ncbi:hypothetical protein SAMN05444166_0195 [Singulisphaera sp. GP187]|uniref:hypothetical protein n=1 Tax=Singulisphaera sp. GP187 TaxID=1882752 RepID=UPI00092C8EDD|nr:hypothetical protein [Singulisphaera sp. GP187]SIN69664.1 hypothetical protein SAMN05444166_0195 [Singulisphaera sp. GP187]
MEDWDEFARTLEWRIEPGSKTLPKPKPMDFDAYEAKTEFRLPQSYRGFLLAAGPGRLCGEFNIASPGYPEHPRIETLNREYRETQTPADLERYSNDMDRALRLHVFGYSDVSFFGWDPREVTDPTRSESAVYELDRLYKVIRLADSFRGFLEDFVLGDGYLDRIGGEWDEDDFGPRREFMPVRTVKG